jgi:hypothetical protein
MITTIRLGVEKTVKSMDQAKDRVVTGVEYSKDLFFFGGDIGGGLRSVRSREGP